MGTDDECIDLLFFMQLNRGDSACTDHAINLQRQDNVMQGIHAETRQYKACVWKESLP